MKETGNKMTLGDRIKNYEAEYHDEVNPDLPIIIRIDGKAFHTYTKSLDNPFDPVITGAMENAMLLLCTEIQQVVFGYTQSDEITIVLGGWESERTQPWYGGKVQKIVSVSASIATAGFNDYIRRKTGSEKMAFFDSRVFNVPDEEEIINALIWRQQDAIRNSVMAKARTLFSHKQMHGRNTGEAKEMLKNAGSPWEAMPIHNQRGSCAVKENYVHRGKYEGEPFESTRTRWVIHRDIPVFTENKAYIRDKITPESP